MAKPRPVESVPELIARLYALTSELDRRFPGRRFTPDGHLIGSLGEAIAAHRYGLHLLPHSTQGHDAITPEGTRVEIKVTQGAAFALRSQAEHLLALHLSPAGEAVEVFNGPGLIAWDAAGRMQRNGQRSISLARLRALMTEVDPGSRLPRVAT